MIVYRTSCEGALNVSLRLLPCALDDLGLEFVFCKSTIPPQDTHFILYYWWELCCTSIL